jgi:predicted enzyme related to lactoylglutathione lyase
MSNRLEHVAIYCKDIHESIEFYRTHFGGQPTAIRKGAAGYSFCFVTIDGAPSIQLMESSEKVGVHHYGFISDDIEGAAQEFKAKNARILREIVISQANLQPSLWRIRTGLRWKSARRVNHHVTWIVLLEPSGRFDVRLQC